MLVVYTMMLVAYTMMLVAYTSIGLRLSTLTRVNRFFCICTSELKNTEVHLSSNYTSMSNQFGNACNDSTGRPFSIYRWDGTPCSSNLFSSFDPCARRLHHSYPLGNVLPTLPVTWAWEHPNIFIVFFVETVAMKWERLSSTDFNIKLVQTRWKGIYSTISQNVSHRILCISSQSSTAYSHRPRNLKQWLCWNRSIKQFNMSKSNLVNLHIVQPFWITADRVCWNEMCERILISELNWTGNQIYFNDSFNKQKISLNCNAEEVFTNNWDHGKNRNIWHL